MNTAFSWKVALSLVALFVLGGISGASLVRAAHRPSRTVGAVERDWARAETKTLGKRLRLRPEQTARLQPILAQTASRMRQVRLETARRIADLIRQNSGQVMDVLDAEQKKEFEQLIRERQSRVSRWEEGSEPLRAGSVGRD